MHRLITLSLTLLLLSSCAPFGLLYTGVDTPINATSQPKGDKLGEACSSSILYLVAFGDASIETARKNGRISKIVSVDGKFTNVLGLYQQYCTIVRGW